MATTKSTAQARFDDLSMYRSIYLRRAIDCSQLTIPSLIPESDQNYRQELSPTTGCSACIRELGHAVSAPFPRSFFLALYPRANRSFGW